MDLRGIQVKHKDKKLGKGIIKDYDKKYITVEFEERDIMLRYPEAIGEFIFPIDEFMTDYEKNQFRETVYYDSIQKKIEEITENDLHRGLGLNRPDLLHLKHKEESKIKEIITDKKIENLVHFTRIENLKSILSFGIIPVSLQKKFNVLSICNDNQRYDTKLDCTSHSITFPNYKLFYKFRQSYPWSSWVVIVLNKDILFSDTNIVYFCSTNAARVVPKYKNIDCLCNANALEDMFEEKTSTSEEKIIHRSSLSIEKNMTTDPQAEVLISDIIDKKYIDCVVFEDESEKYNYISENKQNLLEKYDCRVIPKFFNRRNDYKYWQKEN